VAVVFVQRLVDSLLPFTPRRQWFFTGQCLRGLIKVRSVVQAGSVVFECGGCLSFSGCCRFCLFGSEVLPWNL
jgi:hypothetical protein